MTEFSKASRLDVFQTGIFAALNEEKERLQREGRKLYNLFIGTPDFKPAPHVMQALCEAAADPENWMPMPWSQQGLPRARPNTGLQ